MAFQIWVYTVIAKAVILFTGVTIIYYTARAANRTRDIGLWYLTTGMVLIGSGILLSGVPRMILDLPDVESIAMTSTLPAVGLAVIVYGLFSSKPSP